MTLTTTGTRLEVRPLSGAIGAEVRGVDLREPLPPELVEEIRALWLRYKVVFFPGQNLDPAQHAAFAAQFGELTPAHPVVPGIEGHPEVFEIDYTRSAELYAVYGDLTKHRPQGVNWHTDVTFVERPPAGSVLNAIVIPEAGGDTVWSNQVAAFEALSAPLQELLLGLTAVHDGAAQFGDLLDRLGEGSWEGEVFRSLEPVTHPVVRTHPETGERALFVNPGFTSHIVELSPTRAAACSRSSTSTRKPEFTVITGCAGDLVSGQPGDGTPSSATSLASTGSSSGSPSATSRSEGPRSRVARPAALRSPGGLPPPARQRIARRRAPRRAPPPGAGAARRRGRPR